MTTMRLVTFVGEAGADRLAVEGDGGKWVDLTAWNPSWHSLESLWQWAGGERGTLEAALEEALTGGPAMTARPAPTFAHRLSEVWAAGVTYEQSRSARERESRGGEDFYRRVYDADRPELFFKAPGCRVAGPGDTLGLRPDSRWTVPEPELVAILAPDGQIFGYTVGNDLSARDIEGENPLYLPQAKIFHQSAAMGPALVLAGGFEADNARIGMAIERAGHTIVEEATSTARMRRSIPELIDYLARAWPLAPWTALMTGTGIVPPDAFKLQDGDVIRITIAGIGTLVNPVRTISREWVPPVLAAKPVSG